MKKVIIQAERLLKFAEHLRSIKKYTGGYYDTIELVELDMKVRIHYRMRYDLCILMQLCASFPDDWYFHDGTAIPLLKGKTLNDGPIFCFSKWFGLDAPQTSFLIDIEESQDEMYGGIILNENSSPQDYAQNFEALAIWSQNQQ